MVGFFFQFYALRRGEAHTRPETNVKTEEWQNFYNYH
jgi:hypothetical protein